MKTHNIYFVRPVSNRIGAIYTDVHIVYYIKYKYAIESFDIEFFFLITETTKARTLLFDFMF